MSKSSRELTHHASRFPSQHRLAPGSLGADLEVDDLESAGRELGAQVIFRQKAVDELGFCSLKN
jgi:hypothetical protein